MICSKCIHFKVCKYKTKTVYECEHFDNNEWISVKDRLPNKDGKYLCCHLFANTRYITVRSFAKNLEKVDKFDLKGKKREGWYDRDSEWGYYETDSVTHWLPLPKLPNESEVTE